MKTRNNIDFTRLLASIMVLLGHGLALSNRPESFNVFTQGVSLGSFAVYIFFVLSGYLIARSWTNDPNAIRFLIRRALRLLPALYLFLLVADLLVGPTFTTAPDYFSHENIIRFIKEFNVSDLQGTLPGTFSSNPLPGVFNGSLWTIQYEVACYCSLLIFALAGFVRSRLLMTGLTAALIAAYVYGTSAGFVRHFLNIDAVQFFDLAAMFFYGAAIYTWRDQAWIRSNVSVIVTFALLVFAKGFMLLIALHIFLPPALLNLTVRETRFVSRTGDFGDYSYGLYLYAFPVQQIVMYFWAGKISLLTFDLISLAATFACAFVSWHLVEKRALNWKPRRPARTAIATETA